MCAPAACRVRSVRDAQQRGLDRTTAGMHEALHSEAAGPILDEAADHFRDSVVTSYVHWANVHLTKADRHMQVRRAALPRWG